MAGSTVRISMYKDIWQTKDGKEADFHMFLEDVKNGKWQDIVLPIRAQSDKAARSEMKKKLPCVTISGLFGERQDGKIKMHSGFIGIDLDDLDNDTEGVRAILSNDPYVYSIFTSVSGNGLCVIFKIEGDKHRDAFLAIAAYLHSNYQLIADQSGKNESRARFASYDPHLFLNDHALKFKKYLPKEKPKKIVKTVFVQTDFDLVVNQLASCNICEDYRTWISIGNALIDKFGAGGRNYFHTLSSSSSKYDSTDCDKQFDTLLSAYQPNKAKASSISSVYYYARLNGIECYSEKTKTIISSAGVLAKSGVTKEGIIDNLKKFEGIAPVDSEPIVEQILTEKIDVSGEDSVLSKIEAWLRYNYEFKRNTITRRVEVNGRQLDTKELNSIFIAAKKVFDSDVNFELIERLINSSFTIDFHPLQEFFYIYQDRKPEGVMDAYIDCFVVEDKELFTYFFHKWMVGIISAAYGVHCPLMMVYTGGQGTGKTRAFRDLLPPELTLYYAESKLDQGKDDEILMTQKLIICDDEMGGKSKAESKRLKELTSKQTFSLREPYGKGNVDLQRLAVLCGTTNDPDILNDPTGNRRIIPVKIISIDFAKINTIDRIDLLMEAYWLYKQGWTHELDKIEIERLNRDAGQFQQYTVEYELIMQYCMHGEIEEEMTATEVKVMIEKASQQKLSVNKLGQELQRLGFAQVIKKVNGKTKRVYTIRRKAMTGPTGPVTPDPF